MFMLSTHESATMCIRIDRRKAFLMVEKVLVCLTTRDHYFGMPAGGLRRWLRHGIRGHERRGGHQPDADYVLGHGAV